MKYITSNIYIASIIFAGAIGAQAPLITQAGDPSVKSDTIYKLSVNPADHQGDAFVTLLDDGVIQIESDGRMKRTYRVVAHILNQDGVEWMGELSFPYSALRQKLTINWARVVRPNGQVISDKPAHEQETDAEVATYAPVYTDTKIRRLSMGGVAPGTIVDYSYTIEDIKPVMPGEFFTYWGITPNGGTTVRSRFIVDAPKTLDVKIKERNLPKPRITKDAGDRRIYTWVGRDLTGRTDEPFISDSNTTELASVTIFSSKTWNDVATWYNNLSQDRYTITPAVESRIKQVVGKARTLTDSVRAVHRWIAQDIRYVAMLLGDGGHQPRTPESVLETQYGDCKDKATLFVAIMRKWGLEANPILLSASGSADRNVASPSQFNHMIAAVELNGKEMYADLTVPIAPLGEIPLAYQGSFALKVTPSYGEQIDLPKSPVEHNTYTSVISGTLSEDGIFTGQVTDSATGAAQYMLRATFMSQLDKGDLEKMTQGFASRVFEGGTGHNLEIFNGKDLSAAARMAVKIRDARAATASGDTHILTLPLATFADVASLQNLKSQGRRVNWIDVSEASGAYMVRSAELRITLPEGWRAELPKSGVTKSAFGTYEASYTQNGRELKIIRKLTGADGVQPPSAMAQLVVWINDIVSDNAKFIVLKHSGATPASASVTSNGPKVIRDMSDIAALLASSTKPTQTVITTSEGVGGGLPVANSELASQVRTIKVVPDTLYLKVGDRLSLSKLKVTFLDEKGNDLGPVPISFVPSKPEDQTIFITGATAPTKDPIEMTIYPANKDIMALLKGSSAKFWIVVR